MTITATDDHDSIAGWLAEWGECIAGLDFARARTLFVPEVVGFGTFSDLLVGLDDLEARQWRAVWPGISVSDSTSPGSGRKPPGPPARPPRGRLDLDGNPRRRHRIRAAGTLHGDPSPGGSRLALARHPHPLLAEPRHSASHLPEASGSEPPRVTGFDRETDRRVLQRIGAVLGGRLPEATGRRPRSRPSGRRSRRMATRRSIIAPFPMRSARAGGKEVLGRREEVRRSQA